MEDEGMLGELIQTMLEHLGYEVDIAPDGERAVELYSEALEAGRDYDAVILDLTVKVGMNAGKPSGSSSTLIRKSGQSYRADIPTIL